MKQRRLLAIALLVIGAALFAIGTSAEKSTHGETPVALSGAHVEGEGGESSEQLALEGGAESRSESGEAKILGVDRESNGVVSLAVLLSVVLAALVWFRPTRSSWIVVGVIALAFAIFDIAEVLHQLDVSESSLALLAAAVAIAHLGVTAVAALSLTSRASIAT